MNLLIHKYLTNQASAQEQKELELWIDRSAVNKTYFEFQKRMWNSAKMREIESKINVNDAVARFKLKHRVEVKELKKAGEVRRMRVKPMLFVRLAAACIALLIGSFGIYKFLNFEESNQNNWESKVALSNNETFILADGTKVSLRKGSKLTYPNKFSENKRQIKFSGEAYFQVAKDASKVFEIETENSTVQVLGTKFNVKSSGQSGEQVIVEEGHVRVAIGNREKDLYANDKLDFKKSENRIEYSKVSNFNEIAWSNNLLTFNNTKLIDAIKDVNNVYNINVSIEKPCLHNILLTSTLDLKEKKAEEVLLIISTTLGLKINTLDKVSFQINGDCR